MMDSENDWMRKSEENITAAELCSLRSVVYFVNHSRLWFV
jgi:hypothetical protein